MSNVRFSLIPMILALLILSHQLGAGRLLRADEPDYKSLYEADGFVSSTPLLLQNGNMLFGCHDGTVRAIDAEGNLIGLFATGDVICASPTLLDSGRIAVGSVDGALYLLSDEAELLWSYNTDGPIYGSAAAIGIESLVFGSKDGKLYRLSAEDALLWTFQTGSWITASPAVTQDHLIMFGSWDERFYCINANGELEWSLDAGAPIAASATTGPDGEVYFGTLSGKFLCINSEGEMLFDYDVGDAILSTPTLLESGDVVFGANDGRIYCIESEGALKWRKSTNENVVAKVAVSPDGNLYVGSLNKYLYILRQNGSTMQKEKFPNGLMASVVFSPDQPPIVACLDGNIYELQTARGLPAMPAMSDTVPRPQMTETEPVQRPLPLQAPFRPTELDEALFIIGCSRGDLDQKHELYYQDDCRLSLITQLLDDPLQIPPFAYHIVEPLSPKAPDIQDILIHQYQRIDIAGLERKTFAPHQDESPLLSALINLHETINDPLSPAEIDQIAADATALSSHLQKAIAVIVYGIAEAQELREQALSELDSQDRSFIFDTPIMPFASRYADLDQLDEYLILADSIDHAAMAEAALILSAAVDSSLAYLFSEPLLTSAENGIMFDHNTAIGRITIGGDGPDIYGSGDISGPFLLILDTAGADTYIGRSAGSTASPANGISLLLDLSGDDLYFSANRFSQGCGNLGIGFLLDFSGDDSYEGADYSQGVSCCGVGLLLDLQGSDSYLCSFAGQGAGSYGAGLLLDEFGADEFRCPAAVALISGRTNPAQSATIVWLRALAGVTGMTTTAIFALVE